MALPVALSLVSDASQTGRHGSGRAFVDFDERVVAAQAGVVMVRATQDVHRALLAHAARRLRTSGWVPYEAFPSLGTPLFRELANQLGLGSLPCDPAACAETLLQVAAPRRAAVVAVLPREGTWDRAVASELARSGRLVMVFVTQNEVPAWDGATYELGAELGAADKLRWLSAIAEEAQTDLPTNDLKTLERWWAHARRTVGKVPFELDALGPAERATLTLLALAGRTLPIHALATELHASLPSLQAAGAIVRSEGTVGVSPAFQDPALVVDAPSELRIAAARALTTGPGDFDPDPWAWAHAAELLLTAGCPDDADAAIARALRGVDDPQATFEMSSRWYAAVKPVVGDLGLRLRIRAAERALAAGEAHDALRWCEEAASLSASESKIGLLMGRALVQTGDLVAARVALQKAMAGANEAELRARISSELAEVAYLAGDLTKASELAKKAIDLATGVSTRLAGRNTVGKLHLAEGRWDDADAHFADDALVAAAAGDRTAELRARLNRGIALMSKGRLDDARSTLERVLEDGGRFGEDRARAHALSNLGVVAYRQHDYAAALSFWEQTTRFPNSLRGRMATALTVANLAELRIRLGLVEHAEHAIAFGRRLLGGGAAPARKAHFRRVAAQVALARSNSELARREIDQALADAEEGGDREVLHMACVVAARVALGDGDLARCGVAIQRAHELATSTRTHAEVAILQSLHLRAQGLPAIDAASEALSFARNAGDEDLLAEVHILLATLHRDAGDYVSAQAFATRALAVRDQVAATLPADIRAAFLAKAEMVALSRLQAALASQGEEELPRPSRPIIAACDASSRELVGDDPQIRTLLSAVRKVARANSTVLIRGESGTGKELVADALHRASDRASGPLVSVNCAALVETLLLSELFGHEKGAFTGASARRRGRFEMAEGGTLFLDEIGDISARTQVALLRVLQEKTFERVGGTTPIRANVRVICATHRDLKAMVERGEFREDLYYRLRGITLEVPALRARLGDLPKIADHLLARIAQERNEMPKTLTQDAIELLGRHRWPGNVRELENVLRAVSLFAEGEQITAADLIDNVDDLRMLAQSGPVSQPPMSIRPSLLPPAPPSLPTAPEGDDEEGEGPRPTREANATAVAYAQVRQGAVSLSDIKRQIERDCIARALSETKGNITRAAALLGMKRPRLSQLVKQYGLSLSSSEYNQ